MNISADFANILRAEREQFNARFAAARHRHAGLDGDVFLACLARLADPIVAEVARQAPHAAGKVGMALYDASLELVGARLLGPATHDQHVEQAWNTIFPVVLPWLVGDPVRVVHGVSNAVHHLATAPGAHVAQWIEGMAKAHAHCGDLDTWLCFGQFLAWRCGLAHFRESALALADTLPERLVLGTLGVRDGRTWAEIGEAVSTQRWWLPEEPAPLRLARRFGSFSGFGGLFRQLPSVSSTGNRILMTCGEDQWIVECDSFGTTLHRANEGEKDNATNALPRGLQVEGTTLRLGRHAMALPDLAYTGTMAATEDTLALCSPDTYAVLLIALPGPA